MVEMTWPLQAPQPREWYESIRDNPDEAKIRRLWAGAVLDDMDDGKSPESVPLRLQGIRLGDGVRIVAMEGEPVAEWGLRMIAAFADGVTFALGYANGQGMYLPISSMVEEGGYEVVSFWEYGFPAPLAAGMEENDL